MKFATIGSNFVVDWLLEAGRHCPEFELAAVYSRTQTRGREFAEKWGAPKVYTDLTTLCADPEIEAVYVASPNLCHKEQALSILNAGKSVLCEKPIALTKTDFEEMLATARAHHAVLMEAMRPAHGSGIALIRELLPRIGKVRRATLQFCQYSSRYDKFRAGIVENAFNPTLGNGALMDIGIYCVHLAELLFGAPENVFGRSTFLPGGVDGQGSLLLNYPDMLCEILYSKITQAVTPSVIQGEDGSLLLDGTSIIRSVTLQPRKGEAQVFTPEAAEGGDMVFELTDFIRQAKAKVIDETFVTHSRNALSILDQARSCMGVDFTAKP